MECKISAVQLKWTEDCNIIVGQSHFIKTVEDISEIIATTVPGAKFGLAFCEASGPCLIRTSGNDDQLIRDAEGCAEEVKAGHSFFLVLRDAYPINIMQQLKSCQEICSIFAATANPLQIIIGETDQGRGIIGVIDGFPPKGSENEKDKEVRRDFLRKIGYKF